MISSLSRIPPKAAAPTATVPTLWHCSIEQLLELADLAILLLDDRVGDADRAVDGQVLLASRLVGRRFGLQGGQQNPLLILPIERAIRSCRGNPAACCRLLLQFRVATFQFADLFQGALQAALELLYFLIETDALAGRMQTLFESDEFPHQFITLRFDALQLLGPAGRVGSSGTRRRRSFAAKMLGQAPPLLTCPRP